MPFLSYQTTIELTLSFAVMTLAAVGCTAKPARNAEPASGATDVIQFKTVGSGYRGESHQRSDGQIESRPTSPKKEIKQ